MIFARFNKFMPVAFALMIAAGTFYSKAAVANPFYENVMKCSEPGKKNLKGCLNDFLKYHCLDLSWKNWGSYWACNSTVDQFLDLLDLEQLKIDWVEETGGLSLHEVIFADRTSQIFLTDSKLESTLTTLNAEFDDSYRFSRKHSLWDTISQLKNNQFGDTLEYLAVVFQDIAAKADQSGSPTLHFPLYKMEKLGNALPDGAIKNQLGRNLRAYRDLMEPWTRFKVKENVNDTYFFYPEISLLSDCF